MNVGLSTGSWQRFRTTLERDQVAVGVCVVGKELRQWETVCAGRGLMEGILVSLVLFRLSPGPEKHSLR